MKKITSGCVKVAIGVISLAVACLAIPAARAQDAAEKTYKAKCVACHGADGKGETPAGKKLGARDFHSPDVQKEPDGDLIQIVTKGKNKMPGYEKSLKAREIKDLVAYVRELGKK